MKGRVFFDTSAVFAYVNAGDPDHQRVRAFIDRFRGDLAITNYVFDETVTLVLSRMGHDKAVIVGNTLLHSPQIKRLWVTQADEMEAWKLFQTRDDKGYSLTDCTSFVIMRRSGIKRYLALDDHFKQEGFESVRL